MSTSHFVQSEADLRGVGLGEHAVPLLPAGGGGVSHAKLFHAVPGHQMRRRERRGGRGCLVLPQGRQGQVQPNPGLPTNSISLCWHDFPSKGG